MQIREKIDADKKIEGHVHFEIRDRNTGELIERIDHKNTVLKTAYPSLLRCVLVNDPEYMIQYLRIGDDVGTGTPDNPEAPNVDYGPSNMNQIYESTGNLSIGFSDEHTANIAYTLDGEEVAGEGMALDFTSAALVTKKGSFFSYLRFPRISISDLINITIVWTLRVGN